MMKQNCKLREIMYEFLKYGDKYYRENTHKIK